MTNRQFFQQMAFVILGAVIGTGAFNAIAYASIDRFDDGPKASAEIAAVKTAALYTAMDISSTPNGLAPTYAPTLDASDGEVLWYVTDGYDYSLCVEADGKQASYDSATGEAVSGDCRDDQKAIAVIAR